jgi:hypothetical protein
VPSLAAASNVVPISRDDEILHPDAQKMMANRAAPPHHIISIKSSHASMLSHSKQVAGFIKQATYDSAAMSHSA